MSGSSSRPSASRSVRQTSAQPLFPPTPLTSAKAVSPAAAAPRPRSAPTTVRTASRTAARSWSKERWLSNRRRSGRSWASDRQRSQRPGRRRPRAARHRPRSAPRHWPRTAARRPPARPPRRRTRRARRPVPARAGGRRRRRSRRCGAGSGAALLIGPWPADDAGPREQRVEDRARSGGRLVAARAPEPFRRGAADPGRPFGVDGGLGQRGSARGTKGETAGGRRPRGDVLRGPPSSRPSSPPR